MHLINRVEQGIGVHRFRLVGLVIGLAMLCASTVIGLIGGRAQVQAQLDQALASSSVENAAVIDEYFERARTVNLLLAQNPVFAEHFRESPRQAGHHDGTAASAALAYLERLYPGRIGEACLIDRNGVEAARVVDGTPARHDELSHEEADNAFFGATVQLSPGRVRQERPYVSPDTGEWVISNSTMIPWRDGPSPALVHFEVTVDSFRREAERRGGRFDVMVVDGRNGRIVAQTGRPQRAGAELGRAATSVTRAVVRTHSEAGSLSVEGARAAFRRVEGGRDNANDWYVVATSRRMPPLWSSTVGKGALISGFGAIVLLASSLVALRSYQRQLRRSAETDPLTGLPNRTRFHQQAAEQLQGLSPHGSTAVLLLDLDGFKEVNDTLGHPSGDRLLQQVAQRLRTALRASDLVARLGGDEFAILLPCPESAARGITETAERLLAALRRPYLLDGVGVHVDGSIGVAIAPAHGKTAETLLQHADVAMYQAKRANAGLIVYSPDADPHDTRRLQLVAGLLEAIERRELVLHYQPQVDLDSGRTIGVEALVRWVHPQLGQLPPAEFIPIAESTGLIRPLTLCVLDQALADCRRWLEQGRHLPVAVNCSAVDVLDRRLPEEVTRLLLQHDVPPHMLRLELTESTVMADPERAIAVLGELHSLGVGLSVDDFGTGHSSLAYLKRLPLDELKIDRAFVSHMAEERADAFIVRSTIDLAHNLGLTVLAEGVENEATAESLRRLGCDAAQGFHLARPMPLPDLELWLDESPSLYVGRRPGRERQIQS